MDEAMLRYDDAPARRGVILRRLRRTGFLSITDLSRELGVSDMTVRRDLRKLEQEGTVRVVRGGVSLPPTEHQVPGFAGRARTRTDAKRRIGCRAAELVRPGDAIAVDAGSTPHELVTALPEDFDGSVITHSMPVLQSMLSRPEVRTVGLGGDLVQDSEAFVGPMTVEAAAHLRVRLFFLGAAAIDERGVYVSTDRERPTKRALMDIADEVVLLVDRSKFDASAPVLLCSWDVVGAVVTDARPAARLCRRLAGAGVDLRLADD